MVHEPPHGPSTRRKVIYICVFDGEGRNRTLPNRIIIAGHFDVSNIMFVTDVGDEMCWRQVWDVGDGFRRFCHQHPLVTIYVALSGDHFFSYLILEEYFDSSFSSKTAPFSFVFSWNFACFREIDFLSSSNILTRKYHTTVGLMRYE